MASVRRPATRKCFFSAISVRRAKIERTLAARRTKRHGIVLGERDQGFLQHVGDDGVERDASVDGEMPPGGARLLERFHGPENEDDPVHIGRLLAEIGQPLQRGCSDARQLGSPAIECVDYFLGLREQGARAREIPNRELHDREGETRLRSACSTHVGSKRGRPSPVASSASRISRS